ncbi:hypothetical protein [Polyangium mundeleinium]|uniref:Uncharacterized protein n=1 Tax=Polyangium mundeleinium TaxID=2995306 RepID=A0ABT5ERE4_9BACT|nr:hypothetical protein [Polyangium mundeleinium]MDC0743335.1 hypothetical protein [Polyangium mundeleinium]
MKRTLERTLLLLVPLSLATTDAIAEPKKSVEVASESVARCTGENAMVSLRLRNQSGQTVTVRASAAVMVACRAEDSEGKADEKRGDTLEVEERIPDNGGRSVTYTLVLEGRMGCNAEERVAAIDYESVKLEIDGQTAALRMEGCQGSR